MGNGTPRTPRLALQFPAPSEADLERVRRLQKAGRAPRRVIIIRVRVASKRLRESGVIRIVPEPTPPRQFKRGRKLQAPHAILITSYRAEGSIGSLASVIYGGLRETDGPRYEKRQRRYFELQSSAPKGFPDSPGVWTSLEEFALGQVNYPGRKPLREIERELNMALNLLDARGRLHRFQNVYRNWKWKYQVVEVLTVPVNRQAKFNREMDGKQRRVVTRLSGSSRFKR